MTSLCNARAALDTRTLSTQQGEARTALTTVAVTQKDQVGLVRACAAVHNIYNLK